MSKVYYAIAIVFLVSFFSCTKTNKQEAHYQATQDSIKKYLDIAKSDTVPFEKRDLYNSKAFGLIAKGNNDKTNREQLDVVLLNYFNLNDWKKYNVACKLLLKNSLLVNDSLHIADSFRYKGNFFYKKACLDSSYYFYNKAEIIYKKIGNEKGLSVIYLKKGIILFAINDYYGSEISLKKACKKLEEDRDYYRLYSTLNYLGLVAIEMNEYDKALEYFKKALEGIETNELNSSEHERAITINNIGLVYQKKNEQREAISYFDLARKETNLIIENPSVFSIITDNLAYSKLKLNDFSNLPKLFYEALKTPENKANFLDIISIKIHLSEYYFQIKDTSNAIICCEKALISAHKYKNPHSIVNVLKQAAIIDKRSASKYIKEYIHINDSLQLAERKTKNQFLKIQLETNEITQEKENAIKQKWVITSIIASVLVIVILLFIIYFQRAKQKELKLLQSQQIANEETYQIMLKQQDKEEQVRQEEKKRIALELHDNIMNKLASTRHNLFTLTKVSEEETAKKAAFHIDKIHDIENEIRSLSHDLTKDVFSDTNSFIKLLNELIKTNKESYAVESELEIEPQINWDLVSGHIKMHLYRIIQEGIHNSNKYAKATKITISIIQDEKNLCMAIEDNGEGFNTKETNEGIGLKNMKERIELLGGKFSIHSDLSQGTKLFMAIPAFE